MMVRIEFIEDTHIVVQDTEYSMPYSDKYEKGDIEDVDLLIDNDKTIHVQFENGAIGWIPKRRCKIITDPSTCKLDMPMI